jgi:hypothetical protein
VNQRHFDSAQIAWVLLHVNNSMDTLDSPLGDRHKIEMHGIGIKGALEAALPVASIMAGATPSPTAALMNREHYRMAQAVYTAKMTDLLNQVGNMADTLQYMADQYCVLTNAVVKSAAAFVPECDSCEQPATHHLQALTSDTPGDGEEPVIRFACDTHMKCAGENDCDLTIESAATHIDDSDVWRLYCHLPEHQPATRDARKIWGHAHRIEDSAAWKDYDVVTNEYEY